MFCATLSCMQAQVLRPMHICAGRLNLRPQVHYEIRNNPKTLGEWPVFGKSLPSKPNVKVAQESNKEEDKKEEVKTGEIGDNPQPVMN